MPILKGKKTSTYDSSTSCLFLNNMQSKCTTDIKLTKTFAKTISQHGEALANTKMLCILHVDQEFMSQKVGLLSQKI